MVTVAAVAVGLAIVQAVDKRKDATPQTTRAKTQTKETRSERLDRGERRERGHVTCRQVNTGNFFFLTHTKRKKLKSQIVVAFAKLQLVDGILRFVKRLEGSVEQRKYCFWTVWHIAKHFIEHGVSKIGVNRVAHKNNENAEMVLQEMSKVELIVPKPQLKKEKPGKHMKALKAMDKSKKPKPSIPKGKVKIMRGLAAEFKPERRARPKPPKGGKAKCSSSSSSTSTSSDDGVLFASGQVESVIWVDVSVAFRSILSISETFVAGLQTSDIEA